MYFQIYINPTSIKLYKPFLRILVFVMGIRISQNLIAFGLKIVSVSLHDICVKANSWNGSHRIIDAGPTLKSS